MSEVYVGRVPVDNDMEVSNFVRKTLYYDDSDGMQYLRNVYMFGEYLGFGGVADWGGNYKDEVKQRCDSYGYETSGVSPDYDVFTMYDRDRYMQEERIDISSYTGDDNAVSYTHLRAHET